MATVERNKHARYGQWRPAFFEVPFELPKDYMKQAKLTEKGTLLADVLTVVEESKIAHL